MKKAFAVLALLAAPAFAGDDHDHHVTEVDGIRIQHVWTVAGADPAPVYLEIINDSDVELTLTGAESDWAEFALVGAWLSGGQSTAQGIDALRIAPGARMHLEPGGVSLMAGPLSEPLTVGDHLDIHLHFNDLEIEAEAEVFPTGTKRHPHAGHDH
ncbi:copper chaperone PCu(A)C [Paracoccus sp. (in: a-proteobacteria)]|uniref:copper chaperone PCu(A)C n=1 Tax=Paracoccus sp. TaxID=267 RepID=UPI0026DFCACA|nr:copper chaperone PCu(A)C [Paracoccus sp. (in: a-proteobacteria)]MDO5646615.1 copper chaperone PCu(A)C [Paracoccus sp. (in: a-proteobacteria)]